MIRQVNLISKLYIYKNQKSILKEEWNIRTE